MKDITRHLHDLRHARRDAELKKYWKKGKPTQARRPVPPADTSVRATVVAVHLGGCAVQTRDGVVNCQPAPGVAVGDEVEVAHNKVVGIMARRSVLSRPDPYNPQVERVLAANVDLVVIVGSAAAPPFRPGLIDRITIAVEHGGATPVICMNKIELSGDVDVSSFDAYHVIKTSCVTGEGIEELQAAVRGRTCVFTGHSGVGKSSLINALFPDLNFATGGLVKKGRHTTSSSCLHEEPDGTRVIDTPGIREFGLWRIRPEEVPRYFPEFRELAGGCRFSDCTHSHEPDCAVRTAQPGRYDRYLRLLGSLSQ